MKKFIIKFEKFLSLLSSGGVVVAGLFLFLMMLYISTEVLLRFVFKMTIPGAWELVTNYLMPLCIFPAFLVAYRSGILPRTTYFITKLPEKWQDIANVLCLVIEAGVFALLTIYTFNNAVLHTIRGTAFAVAGTLMVQYPIFYIVSVGFGFLTLEAINQLIQQYIPITKNAKQTNV